MGLEMCEICDNPTGNAGRMDDSYVCYTCNRIICDACGVIDDNGEWMCYDCQEHFAEEDDDEDFFSVYLDDFKTGKG